MGWFAPVDLLCCRQGVDLVRAGFDLGIIDLLKRMKKDASPAKSQKLAFGCPYSSMPKAELEALAVEQIREQRRLMAADEAVYEEWLCASNNPDTPADIMKSLQDEYFARQMKAEAQQEQLSSILDLLGYVPEVRDDSGDD
jgi:hypothetical protein